MVDEWLADNYRQVRAERGITWEQLATDLDRQGAPELAAWAREQDTSPTPRQAKRRETTSTKPLSTR